MGRRAPGSGVKTEPQPKPGLSLFPEPFMALVGPWAQGSLGPHFQNVCDQATQRAPLLISSALEPLGEAPRERGADALRPAPHQVSSRRSRT